MLAHPCFLGMRDHGEETVMEGAATCSWARKWGTRGGHNSKQPQGTRTRTGTAARGWDSGRGLQTLTVGGGQDPAVLGWCRTLPAGREPAQAVQGCGWPRAAVQRSSTTC